MQKETTLALLREMLGPGAEFRDGQWEAIVLAANQRRRLLVVQRTGWGRTGADRSSETCSAEGVEGIRAEERSEPRSVSAPEALAAVTSRPRDVLPATVLPRQRSGMAPTWFQ